MYVSRRLPGAVGFLPKALVEGFRISRRSRAPEKNPSAGFALFGLMGWLVWFDGLVGLVWLVGCICCNHVNDIVLFQQYFRETLPFTSCNVQANVRIPAQQRLSSRWSFG